MKVIYPHDISLKSTNVTANAEDEWSAATTYGLGALVQVTTAFPHTVYKSLRGNNTNRPPAAWLEPQVEIGTSVTSVAVGTGSKSFTTQTGLGFSAGMEVVIAKTTTPSTVNMTGEVTSYNSGTGALVVSVASVKGDGTHAVWTISSKDEIGFWAEVGSTNQCAMFDDFVNTQTVMLDEIYVKLNTTRADHVALFGLSGMTVDFYLWDATETNLLWSKSISLAYGSSASVSVSNWYEYFLGAYSLREDADTEIGVIIYSGVLGIKITAAEGQSAKCGGVIVGREYFVGIATYGMSAGMTDFSQEKTDVLGRTRLVPGYWAKRNRMQVIVQNNKVDSVYKLLTSLRGKKTAWLGNNDGESFEAKSVLGHCRDWDIVFSGVNRSGIDIEVIGTI